MKKIITTTMALLVTVLSFAQFSFGPKAALNFSKFSTSVDGWNSSRNPGFDVGIFARIGNRVYLQPELVYSFKSTDLDAIQEQIKDLNSSTIDVPVLVGFKLFDFKFGNLRVFAGPKFSFLIGDNFEDTIKSGSFNFAGQAGVGIDLLMLTFDLRYDYTFTNTAKTSDVNFHTNAVVLSLGVKLF